MQIPRPMDERRMRRRFLLAAAGSLLACGSVALSAYASHAAIDGAAREWLVRAWQIGLAHGIVLSALSPLAVRRWTFVGLLAILAGTLLFCGSLAAGAIWGLSTAAAPFGGMLLILGWLSHAFGQWRR